MDRSSCCIANTLWPHGMGVMAAVAACLAWAGTGVAQVAIPPGNGPEGRAAAPEEVVGRIVKIDDRRVTVELNTPDKRRVAFMVPLAAEVVLNKRDAMLDDLRPADFVRITISPADPKVAQRVLAARVVADPKPSAVKPSLPEDPPLKAAANAPNARHAGMGVMVVGTPGTGVLVTAVQPRGPAQQAGLRPGDFLTALGGDAIDSPQKFVRQIEQQAVGTAVKLTRWREGQSQDVTVKLASAAVSPDAVGLPGPQAGTAPNGPMIDADIKQVNATLPAALADGAVAGNVQAATQTQLLQQLLLEIRALRREVRAAGLTNAGQPAATPAGRDEKTK